MTKSYCSFPFEHQYVHMSGSVRLCCATMENATDKKGNRVHMNNDSLQKAWNSDYIKNARLKMINGEVLEACTKCVEQEARGYKSMREENNRESNFQKVNADGSMDIMPYSLELHFGNVCNLKCKMCGQNYSNQIGKEILQIGKDNKDFLNWVYKESGNVNTWTNNLSVEYKWFQNKKIKNKLFEYVSQNITRFTVIGGEPTIIPEFYELLNYCHERNTLKDKTIILTTNLTNVNPKLTKWLPKLKQWTVWASVDGLGERTEYIRYPSNFKKVVENLNFYKKLVLQSNNGKIVFSPAIQLLNIDQLDDIIKWWLEFSDGNFGKQFGISWMAQVHYPTICNYDILPKEYKDKIADKLEKSSEQFKNFSSITKYYNNQITNLRHNNMSNEKKIHFQKAFIRYNDTQDKHRGHTTWRNLLPNLEEALTKAIK